MKIGKYPVKFSYKIPRLIADVFSLALAVLIVSVTVSFFQQYDMLLYDIIGAANVDKIVSTEDPTLVWRKWIALIFPLLTAGIIAAYLILTLKSHSFSRWQVTKRTAQKCYDTYAFCVSLCKIPALLAVFDVMYIVHNTLLGVKVSLFSFQLILDVVMIAIIIRFTMHRITSITAVAEKAPSHTVRVRAVAAEKENDTNDNSSDNKEEA